MITSSKIVKIVKDNHNKWIVNNYYITGNEKNIKLNIEEVNDSNIIDKEKQYGIVCYDKPYIFGKKTTIPSNLKDVNEPLRILIDEDIYNEYLINIKKLIVLNTDKENINLENATFKDLMENFQYEIIYKKYNKNDLQNRYLPLPGKYNDSREIYQLYSDNSYILDNSQMNLFNWYKSHLHIRSKIFLDINKTLKNIFNLDKFYFQENHSLRFSYNNNIGTPMHIDSCSKLINNEDVNKYLLCEGNPYKNLNDKKGYVETFQDENILNINYIIFDQDKNNQLRISTLKYDEIGKKDGYFFKVKLNYDNEAFIFNSSKYLHYKSFNNMKLYIRGDIRFISKDKYNYKKFKLYRGPRQNMNVSFCISKDKEKLNDTKVKYTVFK